MFYYVFQKTFFKGMRRRHGCGQGEKPLGKRGGDLHSLARVIPEGIPLDGWRPHGNAVPHSRHDDPPIPVQS